MLNRYEKYLKILDLHFFEYFNLHKDFIHCKKGCCDCCKIGEYPFSRLEVEYLMHGFITLPPEKQKIIKQNIQALVIEKQNSKAKRFLYKCPILIDNECALYKYRGLVCRTHGLAYVSGGVVHLPECVNSGLNYSGMYNQEAGEIVIENPIKEDLHIDKLLKAPAALRYNLEAGEIRPLLDWFCI